MFLIDPENRVQRTAVKDYPVETSFLNPLNMYLKKATHPGRSTLHAGPLFSAP